MSKALLVAAALLPVLTGACGPDATPEDRVARAPVVFHGLAVQTDPATDPRHYSAQFWLISVYKGSAELAGLLRLDPPPAGLLDIRDR